MKPVSCSSCPTLSCTGLASVSMGLNRVERAVVHLTWSLLFLGLVQGWRQITEEEADTILAGRYPTKPVAPDTDAAPDTDTTPATRTSPPIIFDDKVEDIVFDDGVYKSFYKGEANVDWEFKPKFFDHLNPGPYEEVEVVEEGEDPTGFNFVCTQDAFKIYLFEKELDRVKVIGSKAVLSVEGSPKSCGYRGTGTLIVPFTGCFTRFEKNEYILQLLLAGGTLVRRATCFGPKLSRSELSPRGLSVPTLSCPFTTEGPTPGTPPPTPGTPPPTPGTPPPQTPGTQSCTCIPAERLACGEIGISQSECEARGCCWDSALLSCFYPENECTNDGFFVFTIRHNSAPLPLDPAKLEIPGKPSCKPAILGSTFAIYKFGFSECGTHSYDVGETTVYLAEVQTIIETLNLKYGVISRQNQVRFLIECRFGPDSQSLASAGYMVTTRSSTVPTSIYYDGLYGIALSIATDQTYTQFHPTYHPPLRLLLGKPVYLQLRLLSPVPEAVMLVNYCIAYPRYAKQALVLVYEGCANPNDPRVMILRNVDFNGKKNERRFVVDAFQFINPNTNRYINENIYFMCSVSLCFSYEEPCVERCFDQTV